MSWYTQGVAIAKITSDDSEETDEIMESIQ